MSGVKSPPIKVPMTQHFSTAQIRDLELESNKRFAQKEAGHVRARGRPSLSPQCAVPPVFGTGHRKQPLSRQYSTTNCRTSHQFKRIGSWSTDRAPESVTGHWALYYPVWIPHPLAPAKEWMYGAILLTITQSDGRSIHGHSQPPHLT